VGDGHFIFLATVSKAIRETYAGLHSRTTTHHAIAESASRLNWACSYLDPDDVSPLVIGEHGSMEVIYAALALGVPRSADICVGLANSGRCAAVLLMHKQYQCLLSGDVAVALAEAGDLDGVRYVSEHISFLEQTECDLIEAAAESGHTHILQWAHEQNLIITCCLKAAYLAATGGHIETIKWLQSAGFMTDGRSYCRPYALAAAAGDLDAFICFHTATCGEQSQCECMSKAFSLTDIEVAPDFVEGGSLQILEYVRDNSSADIWSPLVTFCMFYACAAEKFELAQLCLEQGANWFGDGLIDSDETNYELWASPATVAWAITNGCGWGDWDSDVCQQFILDDKGDIVQWAHSNGCPCACVR
jgi:hypothetical protein